MRRGWWLLLLLSVGLNLGLVWTIRQQAGTAPGQREREFGSPRGAGAADSTAWAELAERRHRMLVEHLGLAPDRARELDRVHADWMPRIHTWRREVERRRLALGEAYREPGLPDSLVWDRLDRLSRAQAGLDSVVTSALLAELRVLTPEERDRYLRLMPWERRHGGGRDHGPGRGRGHRPGRGPGPGGEPPGTP